MRAVGIILAGGNSEGLGKLTASRATSAMPIGSCFRAIDFPLSNMTNSGIKKVAVITQYNSRSLHDHLSSAKWWDFGRKQGGLFVFTPYLSGENSFWFRGTADAIYQNISFLRRSSEQYVIITSGDCIYKMDYDKILDAHEESGAEITVVCRDLKDKDVRQYGVMKMDADNRVLEFEEKPVEPETSIISMGIYVLERTLLMKMLEAVLPEARYDFVKDIIIRYRKKLVIKGYQYDGYWRSLNSAKAYFDANMDFLNRDIRDLFTKEYPYTLTKAKDEPPAKFNHSAQTKNALIGSGSIINGVVENSVLFRKVTTGEGSVIKNSIIMDNAYISPGCYIENAIIDREVTVSDGRQLIGEADSPVIINKGTVI